MRDQVKAACSAPVFVVAGASIVYALLPLERRTGGGLPRQRCSPSLMVGIVQLAPVLLLPLFYRFKPLDRPALVERLMALADARPDPRASASTSGR